MPSISNVIFLTDVRLGFSIKEDWVIRAQNNLIVYDMLLLNHKEKNGVAYVRPEFLGKIKHINFTQRRKAAKKNAKICCGYSVNRESETQINTDEFLCLSVFICG
ncbi:MAG: hypothetical protein VKL59_11745 [Nostocaceae cyanobacterium]|nr:hypothetical protein [Nostocaceae cyanobacterium]